MFHRQSLAHVLMLAVGWAVLSKPRLGPVGEWAEEGYAAATAKHEIRV